MNRVIDQYIRSEEERAWARKAEELATHFARRATRHDQEGSFPFENFADLREAGYLKLTVPQEFGGNGLSLYTLVIAAGEARLRGRIDRIGRWLACRSDPSSPDNPEMAGGYFCRFVPFRRERWDDDQHLR